MSVSSFENSSVEIAERFYLNRYAVPKQSQTRLAEVPLQHIIVIDCSGSMYADLPEIRKQLKNRLPSLLRDGDTVSIVWFSGRDQYGTLVENYEVANVQDLTQLNTAIDRFLKPLGLTGFRQPLEEAGEIIKRISKDHRDAVFSLFFMSDGYDNQWAESDILKAVETLQTQVASAVIVEYGYYANRNLLTKMAERIGGISIFAENFRHYDPAFEAAMKRRILGGKKVEFMLHVVPLHQLAYAVHNGEILTFSVGSDAKVLVPEDVEFVWAFTGTPNRRIAKVATTWPPVPHDVLPAIYAAIGIFAQRMQSTEVYRLLKFIGDVRLINKFANCFGKQKYSEFQNDVLNAMRDVAANWTSYGKYYDPNAVPREDAFTVLDLLYELSSDPANLFYPNHPLFEYQRTGRKALQADTVLTEEESEQVGALTEQMTKTRDLKKLKLLQEQISAIVDRKREGVKFTSADPKAGYSVSKLTFNESRPNVSALIRVDGHVGLDPATAPKNVPMQFPTHIWRNYTVIRDGIINIDKLPVSLTPATRDKLRKEGVKIEAADDVCLINLRDLPVINRKMVREVSAENLFQTEYECLKLKAAQKVYNDFMRRNFEKESAGLKTVYGEPAMDYLKGLGVTDGGFSPKTTLAETTDFYIGKELKVSLAAMSSLPKVSDVLDKIEAKKPLKPVEQLMAPAILEVSSFLTSDIYLKSKRGEELFRLWLEDKQKETREEVRRLSRLLSEIKFSIVVGQVWFREFSSLDENTLTLDLDGNQVKCTVTMKEIEVKI